MDVREQRNSYEDSFEKDYQEILLKLKSATEDSATIRRAVEQNLSEDELTKLMTLMRERMPRVMDNLGQIYQFLTKYGYNDNVGRIQEDFQPEKEKPEQE